MYGSVIVHGCLLFILLTSTMGYKNRWNGILSRCSKNVSEVIFIFMLKSGIYPEGNSARRIRINPPILLAYVPRRYIYPAT